MQLTLSSGVRISLVTFAAVVVLALSWDAMMAAYRDILGVIYTEQRAFHGRMTEALSELADEYRAETITTVVAGSLLYGVFHAAGPGHGKIVLSTYLLTNPERVRRSVVMAAAAAFCQGVVAVALVYGLFYVFGLMARQSSVAVIWSERLSYGLVIGFGLFLLWRAVRPLMSAGDGHSHGCDHTHVPTAEATMDAGDLRSTLGVIFSIGARPCSGSVLVLVFARFAEIPLAGFFAVAAISTGTAITVIALALTAVYARRFAVCALASESRLPPLFGSMLVAIGGALLIVVGAGLLLASFQPQVRSLGL